MEWKKSSSPSRLIYILILLQFVGQLLSFFYLYVSIKRIESQLTDVVLFDGNNNNNKDNQGRKKRSSQITDDNAVSDPFAGPSVEKSSGSTKGDEWVWVTADTRIPSDAIETFCRKTSELCPPGLPGVPGVPGETGPRGYPGIPGPVGPSGPAGHKGPKGEPGLDGRDGIPGEPGLDGLPGRSGSDGIPGKDGAMGLTGAPGTPGRNGLDGIPGLQGPPGLPGLRGEPGSPGQRGQDGKPGIPSVIAFAPFKTNGTIAEASSVLVPPSIASSSQFQYVVVEEGVNVRLQCTATGKPNPVVQWHRTDGMPIYTGSWEASAVYGNSLNLSAVHRDDMGNYTCTAENGVPPSANKKFRLNVKFGPLIRTRGAVLRVRAYQPAQLECEIEAHPKPEVWWERKDGSHEKEFRPVAKEKHRHETDEYRRYKMKMKLTLHHVQPTDFGIYYCVAKNSLAITRGAIVLKDSNDRSTEPKDLTTTFGKLPPQRIENRDLCPPSRANCDSCPKTVCGRPVGTNQNLSGVPPRVAEGVIGAVGKAVFIAKMDDIYGVMMQDASPRSESSAGKLWVTRRDNASYIFEYNSMKDYDDKATPRAIKLPYPFQGNGHLVNDGHFFYNPKDRGSVVRFDLSQTSSRVEMQLPGVKVDTENYLYTPNHNFNYVDFDVDENGVWAIYGTASNGLVVTKIDPSLMRPQFSTDVSTDHHRYGEMFIARGVLYAVHSVTEPEMNISLAVDIYKGTLLNVTLSFANGFQKITMLRYNGRTKELYAWDKGVLLAYQVRYKDTDYSGPMFADAKDLAFSATDIIADRDYDG